MAARSRAAILRTIFLGLVLVGLVAYLVVRGQMPSGDLATAATPLSLVGYKAEPLEDVPDLSDPASLRRPRTYLVPDRRFTQALERIHAFYTGESLTVTTAYRDDGWDVAVGPDISFRWPEPVDFGDYLTAAERVIEALEAAHPIELNESADDAVLASFDDRLGAGHLVPLIDIMTDADRWWAEGTHDPRLLVYAAEAAGRMAMEADDKLRMTDDLDAYALFLLSLERHTRPYQGTVRREVRLADSMGYQMYARSKAPELASNDPVRALALDDYGDRKRTIPYAGASPFERFRYERWRNHLFDGDQSLLYRRMLSSRPFDQALVAELTWLSWWGTVQEVPVMQASLTGLALTTLLERNELAEAYREMLATISADPAIYERHQYQMDAVMKRYSDPFDWRLWELLRRFEEQKPAGPIADYTAIGLVYRSYLISSIYRVGEHLMEKYGSVEAVTELLDEIPETADPTLTDYRRWLSAMRDVKRGSPDAIRHVQAILDNRGTLGHKPYLDAYERYSGIRYENPLSSANQAMYDRIQEHADGRPYFRNAVSIYAESYVFDRFRRLEELEYISQLAPDNFQASMIWYAVATRDHERLDSIFDRDYVSVSDRIKWAKERAALEGWSDDQLIEHFLSEAETAERPARYFDEAISLLYDTKQYRRIVELGEKLLPKDTGFVGGIGGANFRADFAIAHYNLGEYEEAWALMEPTIPVYTASSLVWGSRILDALGETERSRELAEAAIERYSHLLTARMRLAEWHWYRDDYEGAAEALTAPGVRVETAGWRPFFAIPIVRVFEDRPREDVQKATRALLEAGFSSTTLARAATYLGNNEGQIELALGMFLEIQKVTKREIWILADIYRYMEQLDGLVPARQWWASVADREARIYTAFTLHKNQWHELLWTLYPPNYGEDDIYHAVLQAAACAVDPEIDERYGADTRAFFQGRDGWYELLGRFLLGEEDQQTMAPYMKDPKKRCETSYFLGYIAENEGRIADALQWYLVCTDTGLDHNGEFHWATSRLREFEDRNVSPEVAEAEWREAHAQAGD